MAFQRKWGWSQERLENGHTMMELWPWLKKKEKGRLGASVLDPCAILSKVCQGCQDSQELGILGLLHLIVPWDQPRRSFSSHEKHSFHIEVSGILRGQLLELPQQKWGGHVLVATICACQTLVSVLCSSLFLERLKLEFGNDEDLENV